MGSYFPLFSVAVEHQFFDAGAVLPLDFVPTSATTALLSRCGLLLRKTVNGISVFGEREAQADFSHAADSDEKSVALEFKVFSRDRDFARYTEPVAADTGTVLYFDNLRVAQDSNGRRRLHDEEYASVKAFEEWTSPSIQAALNPQDAVVRPSFLVSISLGEALPNQDAQQTSPTPIRYYIQFAARKTFWKYYFFGDLVNKELYIADLGGVVEFKCIGKTEVANDQTALTFVSGVEISMQDIPEQRFQLRENGAMGEKILIKRLPNASIGQINKEIVNENTVLVSEMYIN